MMSPSRANMAVSPRLDFPMMLRALLANGAVCLAVTLPLLVDVFLKVPFELFLAGGFSKSARESGGKTCCCV